MIWKDTIKKKKFSYKQKKYPTTAQKKNKKLNRLSAAEREKKEEEMREYSREQHDSAISREANQKGKLARKPFEEKINNLKKEREDILDYIYGVLRCSKGHKLYEDKKRFEDMLEVRQELDMDKREKLLPKFCPECGEKLPNEMYTDILDNSQEVLNLMLEKGEKLEQQANEEQDRVYWKIIRGLGG